MLYHKYDSQTLLYVESIETEEQPEHSVAGALPDQTEHYTLAFTDGQWVSVLRPEFEILNNTIKEKPEPEPEPQPEPQPEPESELQQEPEQ